jgi:long-chain acyl-CoA synthetase
MTAIRLGRPTAIIAVPGLYETFVTVIENRIAARGAIVRIGFSFLTALSLALQRHRGLALGRLLFRPLRDRLSPGLRILVSGGARLDPRQQEKLEAWGWMVLVGYGLAETASAFTCCRPAARRVGSAGTPIGSGDVRIAEPDPNGIGEIELRGPQITAGYLNNPEANAQAFTADGWFRTGDLGRLEKDGSLTVTGRTKEMIVLAGGKNLNPEELESRYLGRPEIEEIAILEHDGSLVAIVRPNMPAVRAFGATSARDGIRIVLAEEGQGQRPYERLVGFALTDRPLPKTRLGKYQRFKLPALYEELRAAAGGRPQVQLSGSDREFLGNPVAATFWDVLRKSFPDKATSLAINPHLDLNLDSFGWMELNIEIESRLGAPLSEDVIANAETLRGLIEAYMATDLAELRSRFLPMSNIGCGRRVRFTGSLAFYSQR